MNCSKAKDQEPASRLTSPVPALRMIKGKAKDKRATFVDLVSSNEQDPSKQASSSRGVHVDVDRTIRVQKFKHVQSL
jgi:hypothetical protein